MAVMEHNSSIFVPNPFELRLRSWILTVDLRQLDNYSERQPGTGLDFLSKGRKSSPKQALNVF